MEFVGLIPQVEQSSFHPVRGGGDLHNRATLTIKLPPLLLVLLLRSVSRGSSKWRHEISPCYKTPKAILGSPPPRRLTVIETAL